MKRKKFDYPLNLWREILPWCSEPALPADWEKVLDCATSVVLTEPEREFIELYFKDGLTYKEIAHKYSISTSAAYKLGHATFRLRLFAYPLFLLGIQTIKEKSKEELLNTTRISERDLNRALRVLYCYEFHQSKNKDLDLLIGWEKILQPGDIPINRAFSGACLQQCISHRIFCCRDYLDFFEKRFEGEFWRIIPDKHEAIDTAFSRENRELVFALQYPCLEFMSYNIYFAHLNQTINRESYFDVARSLCEKNYFTSSEEMRLSFEKRIKKLNAVEQEVIERIFKKGESPKETAAAVGIKKNISNLAYKVCRPIFENR